MAERRENTDWVYRRKCYVRRYILCVYSAKEDSSTAESQKVTAHIPYVGQNRNQAEPGHWAASFSVRKLDHSTHALEWLKRPKHQAVSF